MRRWLLFILSGLLALVSCVSEKDAPVKAQTAFPEGEKVTIGISIDGYTPGTKALDEYGELKTLHVAVFGSSGYLKEYVQANPVPDPAVWHEYYTTGADEDPENMVLHQGKKYNFTVSLSLSESPRTLHLLGNGPSVLPFGYDSVVLPQLLSGEDEQAFWQMIPMPDGILAARNEDGEYIDSYGQVIHEGGHGYIPSPETEAAFQGVPLIRNWAKIVLTTEKNSHFTPKALAVVNVPSSGSIVPYSSQTNGFISNYQDKSFPEMEASGYPAYLPAAAEFNNTIPGPEDFTQVPDAVYMYERPVPSATIQPSYVLIYGYFEDPDTSNGINESGDYYYKVDLMETKKVNDIWESRYYPIYRNFKYQVVVKEILSKGYATPAAAAASAGSADVSSDVTTSLLSDISDGFARLHVSPWMSRTFTRGYTGDDKCTELSAFFSQTPDGAPDMTPGTVTYELLDPEDGGDPIISNITIGNPSEDPSNLGWRNISFNLADPDQYLSRTQVLRIVGTHERGRIFRDITITVQPIQPMLVMCKNAFLPKVKGSGQDVKVMIPDGLISSMFPLVFTLEPEDNTLTPDPNKPDNNLPVKSAKSISDHEGYSGKPTFQFLRTLTWEEYRTLPVYLDEEGASWRTINCYFKSNRDVSATTVWVYNEFFNKVSASFENYNFKTFDNLTFDRPIPDKSDEEIVVSFKLQKDPDRIYPDSFPEVNISVTGLYSNSPELAPGDYEGSYVLTPNDESGEVTLKFITTTGDGDISIALSAVEYEDASLVPWHFTDVGFVDGQALGAGASGKWSNVAFGYVNYVQGGKTVLFCYGDDPLHPNPTITLKVDGLLSNGTTKTSTNTFYIGQPYTPTSAIDGSDPLYHPIHLKTGAASYANISYEISANGYVTQRGTVGRFQGDIRTIDVPASALKTMSPNAGAQSITVSNGDGKAIITYSELSERTNSNITMAAGSTTTVTVKNDKADNQLMFVRFQFDKSGSQVLKPESLVPSIGYEFWYRGTTDQWIWILPRGIQEATVELKAPADHAIKVKGMVVKTMEKGKFYTGAVLEE